MNFLKRKDNNKPDLTSYRSKNDKTFLGIFNLDERRGAHDGRKAPLAGPAAIELIMSEEHLDRNNTRNDIHQNIGQRKSLLLHNEAMRNDNQKQLVELDAAGGLLPEPMAQSLYQSAKKLMAISILLMTVEVCGLFSVAKSTFGSGFISAMAVAFLLSTSIALGVHLFLNKLSLERCNSVRLGMIIAGAILAIVGLIGFVLLRAETFTGSMTGDQMDFHQIGLANMLLMAGLTLGVPLLAGSLFDDAMNKLQKSRNSLKLYNRKNTLLEEKSDMETTIKVLEEFDSKLDPICEKIIHTRQGRYIRGFHRGAVKNPEAISRLKLSEFQTVRI